MMPRRYRLLIPLIVTVLQGCRSGDFETMATLQKQVAALTRQVEETRKQVETVQEANQKINKVLEKLESEVDLLKVRESSSPTPPAQAGGERSTPAAQVSRASCSQVWKLLGQGKSETAVAHTLGTTVEAVQNCEREVGRGGTRR